MPASIPPQPFVPALLRISFWSCAIGSIVLLLAAVLVGAASVDEGSTVGLRIGLGLLTMAPVLDAGRQSLGRRFPTSHPAHHEPERWRLALPMVVALALAILLFVDPWLAAGLFEVLGLALDLVW